MLNIRPKLFNSQLPTHHPLVFTQGRGIDQVLLYENTCISQPNIVVWYCLRHSTIARSYLLVIFQLRCVLLSLLENNSISLLLWMIKRNYLFIRGIVVNYEWYCLIWITQYIISEDNTIYFPKGILQCIIPRYFSAFRAARCLCQKS